MTWIKNFPWIHQADTICINTTLHVLHILTLPEPKTVWIRKKKNCKLYPIPKQKKIVQ